MADIYELIKQIIGGGLSQAERLSLHGDILKEIPDITTPFGNTTANFTQPQVGSQVQIEVNATTWMAVNQRLLISDDSGVVWKGGSYKIINVVDVDTVIVELETSADNSPLNTIIPSGATVAVTGLPSSYSKFLTLDSIAVTADGGTANNLVSFDASLFVSTTGLARVIANVLGFRTHGDGGQGFFALDTSAAAVAETEDLGITFDALDDTSTKIGLWRRQGADYDINILWYGAYRDKTNAPITDAAFQSALVTANALGRVIYVPHGDYVIQNALRFTQEPAGMYGDNARGDGEPDTATSIYADENNFTAGPHTGIIEVDSGASYRGLKLRNFNLYGKQDVSLGLAVNAHGFVVCAAHDGSIITDANAFRVHGSKSPWFFKRKQTGDGPGGVTINGSVGQTVTIVNIFGVHESPNDNNIIPTEPSILVDRLQESIFINCKAFGSVPKGNCDAWRFVQCNAVTALECSAAGTGAVGFRVQCGSVAEIKGVNIVDATIEAFGKPYLFESVGDQLWEAGAGALPVLPLGTVLTQTVGADTAEGEVTLSTTAASYIRYTDNSQRRFTPGVVVGLGAINEVRPFLNLDCSVRRPRLLGAERDVVGNASTQWGITLIDAATSRWRYTWNSVGGDPGVDALSWFEGQRIRFTDNNTATATMDARNLGRFEIVGVGNDFVEVINTIAVAEAGVRADVVRHITAGSVEIDYTYWGLFDLPQSRSFQDERTPLILGTNSRENTVNTNLGEFEVSDEIEDNGVNNDIIVAGSHSVITNRGQYQSTPLEVLPPAFRGREVTAIGYIYDATNVFTLSTQGNDRIDGLSGKEPRQQLDVGGATTEWDILTLDAANNVFRYLWNGVGTDPGIDTQNWTPGDRIILATGGATPMNAGNDGQFSIQDVGDNYIDVVNATGVQETAVTAATITHWKEGTSTALNLFLRSNGARVRLRCDRTRLWTIIEMEGVVSWDDSTGPERSVISQNKGTFAKGKTDTLSDYDLEIWDSGKRFTNGRWALLGDDTTEWDVTNPAGNTARYTFSNTGTDPDFPRINIEAGDQVRIPFDSGAGAGMDRANTGFFEVTAVNTALNFFEVTNASFVLEVNVTTGGIDFNGDQDYSLPDAQVGRQFTFARVEDFDMLLDPIGSNQFRGYTFGTQLVLRGLGTVARIECNETGVWDVDVLQGVARVGTGLTGEYIYGIRKRLEDHPQWTRVLTDTELATRFSNPAIAATAIGDATTEWDITRVYGERTRYTYSGTGLQPNVGINLRVGDRVEVTGGGTADPENQSRTLTVLEVGSDFFEVDNVNGVEETSVTTGGMINKVITNVGDATTGWLITATASTIVFVWDGATGTDPVVPFHGLEVGDIVDIGGGGTIAAANTGIFKVTAVGFGLLSNQFTVAATGGLTEAPAVRTVTRILPLVTYSLPSALVGMQYEFENIDTAEDNVIDPTSADTLFANTVGGTIDKDLYLTQNTNANIRLQCNEATFWHALLQDGGMTFEP